MNVAGIIHPRRVPWPLLFWSRAEGSWLETDLVCRSCLGSGCLVSREEAWEGITFEEVACPTCRTSGLLVPARDLPDDAESIWAADEAGARWLDWAGHTGDGLVWPREWAWTISKKRFVIRRDVYVGSPDVLAFMSNRDVLIGLFDLDEENPRRLETVFRLACGEDAEVTRFVMPRRSR